MSKETLIYTWHNFLPTATFFKDDDDSDFGGFTISKEKSLHQKLKKYAEALFQKNIFFNLIIRKSFEIDNNAPATGNLLDSEIIEKVLHHDQNNDDSDDETKEEKI